MSILLKLLSITGFLSIIGLGLAPLMSYLGLPGEAGIVWVTTLLGGLYGGTTAFITLIPGLSLTAAQVAVLTSLMLMAHALPIEVRMTQLVGVRAPFMTILRIVGAILFAWIVFHILTSGHLLQGPSQLVYWKANPNTSWVAWFRHEIQNYFKMFVVIFLLFGITDFVKTIRLNEPISWILRPIFKPLRIDKKSTLMVTAGLLLGLVYGGGYIAKEAKAESLSKEEVFNAVALLTFCHGLIEETILMVMLGGPWSIMLGGRILFAILVALVLVKVMQWIQNTPYQKILVD